MPHPPSHVLLESFVWHPCCKISPLSRAHVSECIVHRRGPRFSVMSRFGNQTRSDVGQTGVWLEHCRREGEGRMKQEKHWHHPHGCWPWYCRLLVVLAQKRCIGLTLRATETSTQDKSNDAASSPRSRWATAPSTHEMTLPKRLKGQ